MPDKFKEVFDVSVTLGGGSVDYPGDTPYARKSLCEIGRDCPYSLSSLTMSAHSGTHIDAPSHFIEKGKTIDEYEAGDFMLPALVVDARGKSAVTPETLADVTVPPGWALLFKTDNSESGLCRGGVFSENYAFISPAAARACVAKRAALVGLDYLTIEEHGREDFESHRTLLSAGVLILEGLDLSGVSPGEYSLICPPLKLGGAEAAPVRAVLIR